MHQKEIQRNAFSIGNQGSDPGKEVFLLLTAKPYAASRPRRAQRPWIHTLGHRLGGMALCGLAATAMQPCQAQSNIQVQTPGGATIWSVNGVDYTGQTQKNIQGNATNSASFQVAPSDVTDIPYSISIQGVSTTLNPGTVTPSATSLGATFTNATTAAFTQSPISLTSLGGISTIGSDQFQNEGSSLTLNATGVGASVILGRNQSNQGYLIQSEGGAGQSTSSPNEANGANGGSITANLTTAQESDSLYSTSVLVYGTPAGQTLVLPWQIPSSAIQASSIGGLGAGSSTGRGSDADWAGNGGAGGSVSVTITNQPNPPSPFGTFSIYLGTEDYPLQSEPGFSVAGILATSVGASNGPCCSWEKKQGSTVTPASDPSAVDYPIGYGLNGSGGTVDVNFSGVISGITSNLYGIVATSVGASTQLPTNLSYSSELGPAQASGLGGDVSVNLVDGSINLGSDSVGVFAASLTDQVILPSFLSVAGTGDTAGSVQVILDGNSEITVGGGDGQFSAGVLAISSTGWLFNPASNSTQGAVTPGNGGDVIITNNGAISATQSSAIGIGAFSLGNGGLLVNNPGSPTDVNFVSNSNAGANQTNTASTVQITNNGTIQSSGAASIGILAVSNGAGGLITGIPDAAFGAFTTDSNNIQIGSQGQASGYVAGAGSSTFTAPGGAVTITNTGSIQSGGGDVALGIVAQSVGGGGASYTEGVALFVGDAGGQGGDGGSITLTNSGPITTAGDGSIGFLGQSIGGGGGHGANTKGLFVAVGGNGGNGGDGGAINATLQGGSSDTPAIISTAGDFASGMLLQSIGGGGGNGGYGKAHGIFWSSGIGGAGGSAGAGGDISITTTDSSGIQAATSGNQSHGLMLQSIGGGGGNGGHAYSTAKGLYFAGAVGIGGSGKAGGAGGSLNLCSAGGSSCSPLTGTIATGGYDSVGVLLQSIGGGGGYGGGAIAEAYAAGVDTDFTPATVSLASSVGGNGGSGGDGNAISMVSGLTVSTNGTGSHAIAAQSIGGGGGAAADSTAGANSYDNTDLTFNAAVGLGGSGGTAGAGGTIELTTVPNMSSATQLSTQGHNAIAILAQSIGGGGGYGGVGNAYANDVSVGNTQVALSFALGGSGGAGGSGGDVTISTGGSAISTAGSQSPGILAQSIGGGGGVAGNGGAQSVGGNYSMNVAVGGNGGSGSTAGNVTITNSANITTGSQLDLASGNANNLNLSQPIVIGSDSPGILAQSIGGGGGVGGNADPAASLISSVQQLLQDGAGDYVKLNGLQKYFNPQSDSNSDSDSDSDSDSASYDAAIAIGGRAGGGGDGQSISVTHQNSEIITYGHRSYGIQAQSIGGGGGVGGSSTVSSTFLTISGTNVGINVGGQGGSGGNGGDVNITLDNAQIITAGYGAHAVLGQSIGGGGGAAHDGSIFSATGNISIFNPTIKIGSLSTGGGMQGAGGTVFAGQYQQLGEPPVVQQPLITLGDAASAVLLQSIGGGGGIAGFGCSNSGNDTTSTQLKFGASACFQNASSTAVSDGSLVPSAFQPSPGVQGFDVSIQAAAAQGGSSIGTSSAGGVVNYNYYNLAQTLGNRSIAIVAQSIGGGGGYVSAPAQTITSATLPSSGSNNSSGGDVYVSLYQQQSGNGPYGVITEGSGAWGILAQSIGGGGGFIGDPSFTLTEVPKANSAAGSSSNAVIANGGNIFINLGFQYDLEQPQITTYGEFAHGIVAQSIGAGGGITNAGNQSPLVGSSFAGSSASADSTYLGVGGNIQINIYGDIVVNTNTSMGVFAQSSGTTYPNGPTSQPINIYLDGSIQVSSSGSQGGTPSTGAAIMLSGGTSDSTKPNTIYVDSGGYIGSFNTPAEYTAAIVSDYGYTSITNYGTINGSIDLNGSGEIINTESGTINTGSTVSVSQNSLHNYGLMRIGALETISRTDLEGRFVQHDTGTLELSIDSAADVKSDYLNVSGPMLLSGKIIPRTNTLLRDEIEFAAADSILLNARVPSNFLLYDWQLRSKGNKVSIKPIADFTPESVSLTSNQHSLAAYLQRSWDQGEPSDASLFSYFHTFTRGEADNYTAALKQLGGMALNSQPIQMKTSFSTALSESLTCPTLTPEGLKPNQQSCVWARATGDYSTQSSNDRNSGYWVSAPGIRLGGQSDLGNGWTAGMVFGYGTNYLRSDNFSSNGDFFDAAVSARKQLGNWELGGSLAFAQGWFENSRNVQLQARGPAAAMGGEYSSNSSLSMLGLRLRAAYSHQSGVHQFKPYLDVDLSQAWMPAYRESSGDLSLQSKSASDFNVAITPMLEYTLYSTGKGGSGFKAYLSAGASWLPDNHVSTPMSFRNDQLNNGSFNVVTDGPSLLGRLNVGAEAMISENLEVRAEYNLQMGGGYRNQGISANLRYRF